MATAFIVEESPLFLQLLRLFAPAYSLENVQVVQPPSELTRL